MNPFLDHAFRQIVARIECVSGVPAARSPARDLETTITHGKTAKGSEPPYSDAPHLWLQRRYQGCNTDTQRRVVIHDALEELRSLRYSRQPNVDRDTVDGRLQIGLDPRPVSTLAYVYGYSERHIHRLRAEAKRHSGTSRFRSAA